MKNKCTMLTLATIIWTFLAVPHLAFAQTTETSPQAKLAKSVTVIQAETVATRDQLQATLNALTALTKQEKGDLKPTFETFSEEVKKTHVVAEQTAARITAMQDASKEYFVSWKTQINEINNESLRKKALKRMEAVQEKYDDVIKSLKEASEKFKPFLSNLDDVQKMLVNDITPGGVKTIRGIADDANWNMKKVRTSIAEAIEELGDMSKSLSSQSSD